MLGPASSNHWYVLEIYPLPILSPMLMRIDEARVWINDEPVYRFECDMTTMNQPGEPCLPAARVKLPMEILESGVNHIDILVKGSDNAALLFKIVGPVEDGTPQ